MLIKYEIKLCVYFIISSLISKAYWHNYKNLINQILNKYYTYIIYSTLPTGFKSKYIVWIFGWEDTEHILFKSLPFQ